MPTHHTGHHTGRRAARRPGHQADTEPAVTLTDTRAGPSRSSTRPSAIPSDPAVLLVMGFGTQLLGWDADFCRLLAARGRYVIRYDNRDCGLSTKLDEHPVDLGGLHHRRDLRRLRPRARDGAVLAAGHGRRRDRPARRGSASTALTWWAPRWAA